jgi:hypothetical protein
MTDIDQWLATMATEPGLDELRLASSRLTTIIRAMPDSEYRHLAECKLGDAIAMAFVAAKQ